MNKHFHYQASTLWAEGVPISDIIQAVGTPCYIYAKTALKEQWQSFTAALGEHPHQLCYAVKANSNLAVLQTFAQLGAGFDIVSGGELARVIQAGGDPHKIVFSGVGKTAVEITQALQAGIFCFNVESQAELILIGQIAQQLNLIAPIALRVNPDIDSGSHPYIATGLKEGKFGIAMEEAFALYLQAQKHPHLRIQGMAFHIGSQLTQLAPFLDAFKRILGLWQQLKEHGIFLKQIDIGGGLGVCYQNETPPNIQDYIQAFLTLCPPEASLILEPGRALVADAGILVTKILYTKTAGHKHYCIVDSAMNDLLRPTLYSAWHNIIPVEKEQLPLQCYDVVGPICESGDFLGKERNLAVRVGNHLAVMTAGAYGFVMSSNLNGRLRAAEVMVEHQQFKIIRARETLEQLWAQESLW